MCASLRCRRVAPRSAASVRRALASLALEQTKERGGEGEGEEGEEGEGERAEVRDASKRRLSQARGEPLEKR